jgi:hypothetical protein
MCLAVGRTGNAALDSRQIQQHLQVLKVRAWLYDSLVIRILSLHFSIAYGHQTNYQSLAKPIMKQLRAEKELVEFVEMARIAAEKARIMYETADAIARRLEERSHPISRVR